MKQLLLLSLLLAFAASASAGILFQWVDTNPPGTITQYNFYGSPSTNTLATNLIASIPYVPYPTQSPLFNLTNGIVGQWFFQVTAVSTNNIESAPSNVLGIWAPVPLNLTLSVTNKNTVGPATNALIRQGIIRQPLGAEKP